MATVTWDSGVFNHTSQYFVDEIKKFNTAMLEVGLIDYLGGNAAEITKFENNQASIFTGSITLNMNDVREYITLYYRLPVGDASIVDGVDEFGDNVIYREGYSKTPCYIKFKLYAKFYILNTSTTYIFTPTNISAYQPMSCDVTISTDIMYVNSIYTTSIPNNFFYPNGISPNYFTTRIKDATVSNSVRNVVHLGANNLYIFWGSVDIVPSSPTITIDSIHPYHRLIINLNRTNNRISIIDSVGKTNMAVGTQNYSSSTEVDAIRYNILFDDGISRYKLEKISPPKFVTNAITEIYIDDGNFSYIPMYDFDDYQPIYYILKIQSNGALKTGEFVYHDVRVPYKGKVYKTRYFNSGSISNSFRYSAYNDAGFGVTSYVKCVYYIMSGEHELIGE